MPAWRGPDRRCIFAGDEIGALMHDFNHMAERLESLVDAQKLLLRDVSHELRSPLARLNVALELAREDAEPEKQTHLNRIERETSGSINSSANCSACRQWKLSKKLRTSSRSRSTSSLSA